MASHPTTSLHNGDSVKVAKIIAAVGLIVLLGTFGISNIGGETWVSAGRPLPPGWMRNPVPLNPRPPEHTMLLPVLVLIVLVLIAIFDVIVKSQQARGEEEVSEQSGSTPAS